MLARHFMLRDASHQQVIQKFSFIRELDLSQGLSRAGKLKLDQDTAPSSAKTTASLSQTDENLASLELANANLANFSGQVEDKSSALATLAPATSTIDTNWYQSESSGYGLNLAAINDYSAADDLDFQPSRGNYLGKILFALATGYCLFAFWWLFGHQGSRLLTSWAGGKYITLSKSEVEFIDYAERSLETIERKLEANKENTDKDKSTVYVPVYTPSTAPRFPQVGNLPLTSSPSYNDAPQIPDSAAVTQPPPPSEPLKIPSPPPLPGFTPLESNSSESDTSATPPEQVAAKPKTQYTLIGILELGGDKSAALVKINGQTRRIWRGEAVNNGDWILDSVNNQAINITHNGQSRSIAVGETF